MADWCFQVRSWTLEAVDGASNFTNDKYMGLMGGSTTQRIKVKEIEIGGLESSTSSPLIIMVARDSTVQATPTALSANVQTNAPRDPATAALAAPQVAFTASTTKPQRSTTLILDGFKFNALGGVARHRYAENYEPTILGNTASFGEMSVSGAVGCTAALVGGSIVYEPL